jgi:glycosyltransferase involved in cell wall biosynthesis
MSVGLPVISTDFFTGSAREMIGDDCGMIVPVGDQIAMTEAIKCCLLDSVKRESMGRNGVKISERYSKDKILYMWRSAIEKVVAKGGHCNE